jgi:hypothetical protein
VADGTLRALERRGRETAIPTTRRGSSPSGRATAAAPSSLGARVADGTLRALERRWRETGDPDDEARLLAERLRCGLVTERGLVIAAGLGHAAALRIAPAVGLTALELLDSPRPPDRSHPLDLARARAAIAVARTLAARWRPVARPDHPTAEPERDRAWSEALRAAEAWTLCPCDLHAGLLRHRGVAAPCAAECCVDPRVFRHAVRVVAVLAGAQGARTSWWGEPPPVHRPWELAEPRYSRGLERAVAAELLPWALGERDPLQAR